MPTCAMLWPLKPHYLIITSYLILYLLVKLYRQSPKPIMVSINIYHLACAEGCALQCCSFCSGFRSCWHFQNTVSLYHWTLTWMQWRGQKLWCVWLLHGSIMYGVTNLYLDHCIASFPGSPHSCDKLYQALSCFSALQAAESWVELGMRLICVHACIYKCLSHFLP